MDRELAIAPATVAQRDAVADLWRRTGLTTSYHDPDTDFDRAHGGPASDVLAGTVG